MRRFRSSILLSLLMLVLCASIIVGSTLAYFTDEVSTTGNVIASGTLDASMFWADQLPSETNGVTWQDASDVTLFNNEYWEPNATVVKYIRIDNTGKLAFQYELNVLPTLVTEGGANLMDVIDVYFGKVDETTPAITRSNYATLLQPVGVMSDLLTNEHGTAYGILLPEGANGGELPADVTADEGSVTACVVLHMQETAGNEYQGLSAGEGFNLQLVATQYTYEKDAFGNQYDAGATLPDVAYSVQIAQPVTADENGLVAADVQFTSSNGVAATVPAGAKLADGVTQLVLVVHPKAASANVQLTENDVLSAYEVRVEGLAKDNTVPVLINLGEVLAKGLNIGNYNLYHVENGATNPMTLVDELTATSAHNSFTYNPATGEVSVAMATFSEVAMVADTENAWNGEFDYSWYTPAADGSTTEYIIANADQLAAFGAIVGGMNGPVEPGKGDSFADQTVKLISDINLGYNVDGNSTYSIFYPIGYYNSNKNYEKVSGGSVTSSVSSFEGTFDGNGHTISNFYQNTWEMFGDYNSGYSGTPNHYNDAMGLFGYVYGGTIKNLTVDHFSSDGEFAPTGVIAAYAANATFENIAITNCNPRVYNTGNGGIVGIGGNTDDTSEMLLTFTNITVDNSNKISALWGSWDVACGGLMGMFRGNADGGNGKVHFENCHVSAQIDVYNDVCANYQYYAYRYAGMIIGSIRHNTTNEDGKVIPNMTGISATGCTVNYGDWNDYYYCEFEKNSLASYSEDYQFSRVPHSELNFTDSNGNGSVDADERASVTGCKHNHTAAEDKKAVYLPFHQLFTGYSWGVNSIGLEKYSGIVTDLDITEGDQQESVEKFAVIDQNNNTFTTGTKVAIGDLFTAVAEVTPEIDSDNVQVFVSPVDDSTASGVYEANTTDWSKGTLTFSGLGAATITITDYYFCTPTVVEVEITDRVAAEKFETKFTGDFLYRVGNQNTVSLGSLFKAKDDATIGNVTVKVETVKGASGTYTPNATWTNGTIKFSGTGVVKVTITDNDYCTPTELYLEVVDAVNATSATNATSNNVVLLNDISGGFTVSGRYAVYGNGFTLNYTGNGQYLNNGLKQGVVTVSENGTLDNLRIKASIYPAAYLYYGSTPMGDYVQGGPSSTEGDKTRYHYQLSAVAASGNATISNCYIYGGRNNIFVNTGDVTIKDTVLECGTVANVQIQSNASHTVTFEDVTTVQHRVNATIGDTSKVMMGAGIVVGPETNDNPTIVLNGDFKQYNWVNQDDANAVSDTKITKAIIESALNATTYNHTVNGKTASNLGIIYMNANEATVIDKTDLPYKQGSVTITVSGFSVDGQVYSLQNATANQIYSDYDNADKTTVNGLYQPQFKYSDDLGGQYIAEGGDEHCYRDGNTDTINVMFLSGDTKELDLAGLVNIEKYTDQNLNLDVTCKDENGNDVPVIDNKISLTDAGDYTVTYTVTDALFFDKDGKQLDEPQSIKYSWDVTISVSLKDKAVPNAYFEFDSSKRIMGYAKKSVFAGGNTQYLPFLAGLKIYDYNGQTSYLRFDGDNDFNKIASATITGYTSANHVLIEVKLTDGGVINIDTTARAASGGSTYTGKIQTSGNTIYYVNDGTTSATTTTWVVSSYKFTGNNGVEINSGSVTFSKCENGSVPTGSFSTKIKHTVTYDANEGNCGQTTGYATSASAAVTLPTPTRSGYIFAGWYTAASGGTRVGGAGDSYTPSANITLYAQWGKPCTVTYDANGGSCGTASAKYTGIALTLPTPTRDGYWFVGWYDAATGGNKIGDAGATYNPGGDVTLYAHWQEAVEYTVTYNANGGTCGIPSATYEGTALTLPTPTRTGYTFNGWYTAASGGTKIGDAGASYIPSANITLYAQWQINSYTITVTTSNATVKVNGTTVNNNGTVSIQYGAQVTVEVTYSESDNRSTTITGTDDTTYTSPFTMPAQNVTINATSSAPSSGNCVTPDTLVTLADGTQVRVDSLTGVEELLVWNMETGTLDKAPILFVDSDPEAELEVVHLHFSDGTEVKVIYEHGFWDFDLNKYVYLDRNAAQYIGHTFFKQSAEGTQKVQLVDVQVETETTTAWSPVTTGHLCYFVNGMLSMPGGVGGLFNIFDVDPLTMTYDLEAMARDIETYGLFTYEELNSIVELPQAMFDAAGGAYLKVSIGKGNLTMDDLIYMIERYKPFF